MKLSTTPTHLLILLHFSLRFSLVSTERLSYVYQQDLSEHCKRRAIPSVFLGEHVKDAASKTLMFSRSELPYNCFITVRTEPANDIIIVIQKVELSDLEESCTQHSDQLLIFEMGETFGGYWGPMIRKNFDLSEGKTTPKRTVFYTLHTTKLTTRQKTSTTAEDETNKGFTSESITEDIMYEEKEPTKKMIVEEFPLLEFSGEVVDDDELWTPVTRPYRLEDIDVAPRKGGKYVTNMVPIVEIAMTEQTKEDGRREQLYQLDYKLDPQTRVKPRTKFPFLKRRSYASWSRLFSKKIVTQLDKAPSIEGVQVLHETHKDSSRIQTSSTHSWDHFMELIKSIDKSSEDYESSPNVTPITENLMRTTNDQSSYSIKDNLSEVAISTNTNNIVQDQNLSKTIDSPNLLTRGSDETTVRISHSYQSNDFMNKNAVTISSPTSTIEYPVENIEMKGNNSSVSSEHFDTNKVAKSLVGHESWENVVQAAPEMAMILNQTPANAELDSGKNVSWETNKQKKRHIQAVEIENAKPHIFSTKPLQALTTMVKEGSSAFEFAQFVELQDDEINGRVHLRYLRQFVGPMMYNICESVERSKQQIQRVHLFNSSRIVIAINNFTLSTMSLILTTVRLLPTSAMHCPTSHLECQVSGARVCVDSCVSCDGVPNCGSEDTYDEDRHLCGSTPLHYDVYLAAFTFLAVLCTMLYIIHYWIKRCVPKVSDAFFVYTDGAENVLYLDTIMRSPNELDDTSKAFHGNVFDDDLGPYLQQQERKSVIRSFMKKLRFISRKSGRQLETEQEPKQFPFERKKIYSFQALEIKKMTRNFNKVDESIQTGSSLELRNFKSNVTEKAAVRSQERPSEDNLLKTTITPYQKKELDMLKMLQRPEPGTVSPRPSEEIVQMRVSSPHRSVGTEEEELQNLLYETHAFHHRKIEKYASLDTNEDILQSQQGTSHATKRLRFEEAATAIPSTSRDLAIKENVDSFENFDEIQETESGPKDFMWFWTGSKAKKHKKKALQPSSSR